MIQKYHYYCVKDEFISKIWKKLQSSREADNNHDGFALANTEDETTVKHVPHTISVPCDRFVLKSL